MQCESCHASDKQPAIAHLQQFGPFRVPSTRSRIYAFPIGSLAPHPEDGCGGDSWGRCNKIKGFTMNYKHTVPLSSHFSNSLLIFQVSGFRPGISPSTSEPVPVFTPPTPTNFPDQASMRLYMPQGEHTSNLVMPRGVFGYDMDDRGA
ncbi:hypothetical protein QC763_100445 [Podospora pseudopauciseta]|uniref:Uncharacterized protein n=1 Tax=Podospora pseudopauciseta TaxID=2093780 RepID=A0ABR0HW68_9PEZI|nr:hypothetical protein QC763_100445 [Podospora pseudopauciseta]